MVGVEMHRIERRKMDQETKDEIGVAGTPGKNIVDATDDTPSGSNDSDDDGRDELV